MFEALVLGLDPGLTRCGWGLVTVDGPRLRHVDHGTIRTPRDVVIGDRLAAVHAAVETLLAQHRPGACSLERVLFNGNARTAMATGQAAGVVLLACASASVPVTSYSPSQVKSAVCGYGAADKAQVRHAVTRILDLGEVPQTDAADALALALVHATSSRLDDAVSAKVAAAPSARSVKSRLDSAIGAALARDARPAGRTSG